MGAMFIGQQFLQNVLGYSTLDAGMAILPAAILMVLIAPRSAKLVVAKGARFTLLVGYVFCFLGFLTMLLLWKDGIPYWKVGLGTHSSVSGSALPARRRHTRSQALFQCNGRAWLREPRTCSAISVAPSCSRSWARC
jgi:hypothetical protein